MLRNVVFFSDKSIGIFNLDGSSQTELLIQTVCMLRHCSVSASYVLDESSFDCWFDGAMASCFLSSSEA